MINMIIRLIKFLFGIRTSEDVYKDSLKNSKIIDKYRN